MVAVCEPEGASLEAVVHLLLIGFARQDMVAIPLFNYAMLFGL
jgi:hypothetical protein